MFDGIARRYDLLNHLLSLGVDRGWRRRVVRAVRAERPRSVLDMARIATAGIFSEAWRRFIRPAGRTRVKKLKKDDEHEKSMDRGGVRVGRRVVRPHGGYLL